MATRILFVLANPTSTSKLELADELRRFQHALRGQDVKLMLLPAAQYEDLRIAVETRSIDIVHFSGHAKDEGILMRNRAGVEDLVPKDELLRLFTGKGIKLAVLNACETGSVAEALSTEVNTVIGTSEKIDDRAARILTKVFYSELGTGQSVADAYQGARDAVDKYDPSLNVYTDFGMDNAPAIFEDTPTEGGEVELEGKDSFDRYFYIDYLDKQIQSLVDTISRNQLWFKRLFAPALAITIAITIFHYEHIWHMLTFFLLDQSENSGTPLTESIFALAAALPTYFAYLKRRLVIEGNVELVHLQKLKEMVRASDDMTPDLRNKLHKILDQSLRGAEQEAEA